MLGQNMFRSTGQYYRLVQHAVTQSQENGWWIEYHDEHDDEHDDDQPRDGDQMNEERDDDKTKNQPEKEIDMIIKPTDDDTITPRLCLYNALSSYKTNSVLYLQQPLTTGDTIALAKLRWFIDHYVRDILLKSKYPLNDDTLTIRGIRNKIFNAEKFQESAESHVNEYMFRRGTTPGADQARRLTSISSAIDDNMRYSKTQKKFVSLNLTREAKQLAKEQARRAAEAEADTAAATEAELVADPAADVHDTAATEEDTDPATEAAKKKKEAEDAAKKKEADEKAADAAKEQVPPAAVREHIEVGDKAKPPLSKAELAANEADNPLEKLDAMLQDNTNFNPGGSRAKRVRRADAHAHALPDQYHPRRRTQRRPRGVHRLASRVAARARTRAVQQRRRGGGMRTRSSAALRSNDGVSLKLNAFA